MYKKKKDPGHPPLGSLFLFWPRRTHAKLITLAHDKLYYFQPIFEPFIFAWRNVFNNYFVSPNHPKNLFFFFSFSLHFHLVMVALVAPPSCVFKFSRGSSSLFRYRRL